MFNAKIREGKPVCPICEGLQRIYLGSNESIRCKCLILKLYEEKVPDWIRDAPKTTNDRPVGLFNCLIGPQERVGCWLDNMYQYLFEVLPSSFESRFPQIISDDGLVEAKFAQGDFDELTSIDREFVMIEQTALKGHAYMPNTVYQYVRRRVDAKKYTWLIRSTPIDKTSFDYSPELEKLVSSRFTITDLR